MRAVSSMPEYFSRHGLREPSGQVNTIYSYAAGDPAATVWEIMNRDPARMQNFMVAMAAGGALLSTAGVYDFGWVDEEGKDDPERTLIVDVGGGKGHALEAILEATPGLDPSRCVVEDLEAVVDEARETADGALEKARFVAMDFHSEQPVKGTHSHQLNTHSRPNTTWDYTDTVHRRPRVFHPPLPPRLRRRRRRTHPLPPARRHEPRQPVRRRRAGHGEPALRHVRGG